MNTPPRDAQVPVFRIDGSRINAIADLYAQLNALLMESEDWQLGSSLDALNDVLYRFTPHAGAAHAATFIWQHHAHSREALGIAATLQWLDAKLQHPGVFNAQAITAQRQALLDGTGTTYFDLVLEVFAGHPQVALELA